MSNWFRSDSIITPIELWYWHTIGQIREWYNLRRVTLKVNLYANICRGVLYCMWRCWCWNSSTDPIIKTLPFLCHCIPSCYILWRHQGACWKYYVCFDYIYKKKLSKYLGHIMILKILLVQMCFVVFFCLKCSNTLSFFKYNYNK